jgi:DNA-binding CsgD family transcriptional regulator
LAAKTINDESTGNQLTEREIDVLKEIVKGKSNKEIAEFLNISIHTVITHRKNITQKTGIKSQSGLTIYSINNKIVSLENLSESTFL